MNNPECTQIGCPNLPIHYGKYCEECINGNRCQWGRCMHSSEDGTKYCSKHIRKRPCRHWGCCNIAGDSKNYCNICILLHTCHKDGCGNMLPKSWDIYCNICTTENQIS